MDNFKTHAASAFYELFEPEEAKRLWDRFEFIYTPKHGSWLNMAEIELQVLNGQCLNRHISTMDKIKEEVEAWQSYRNNKNSKRIFNPWLNQVRECTTRTNILVDPTSSIVGRSSKTRLNLNEYSWKYLQKSKHMRYKNLFPRVIANKTEDKDCINIHHCRWLPSPSPPIHSFTSVILP